MTFLTLEEELMYFATKQKIHEQLERDVKTQGYMLIEPSFFEDYDTFTRMNPRLKKETMVKMIGQDGKVLVLRPDVTTAIMKQVLPKWDQHELKLYYLSTRFKMNDLNQIEEQKQFGIERLGNGSKEATEDVLLRGYQVFENMNVDYMMEISDSRWINTLIQEMTSDLSVQKAIKNWIDYKDRYALDMWLRDQKMTSEIQVLSRIFDLQGTMDHVMKKLEDIRLSDTLMTILNDLKRIESRIESVGYLKKTTIDLSMISAFDYYDGVMFKGYLKSSTQPVLRGGRYDPLTEQLGRKCPAIGFTLTLKDLVKEVFQS
jgi:ATP phosphoribosyltransferase regulatory subunit